MRLPGASVAEADTPGGAAIVFTTTGDVDALRARVRRMAEMHERIAHGGMGRASGGGPETGQGMHCGCPAMGNSAEQVRAEDIASGARLVFVPAAPADLDSLRDRLRAHVQRMQSQHGCAMMHEGSP
jgi:hypothetical protein